VFGGGPNQPCSICGEIVPETAEDSFEFRYPDGRIVVFHDRCEFPLGTGALHALTEVARRRPSRCKNPGSTGRNSRY
jgi:hypothetical protein